MCGITSWSLNEPRKEVAGSFLQCEYLLAFVFSFSCSPHNECDPPSWKTIHLQPRMMEQDPIYPNFPIRVGQHYGVKIWSLKKAIHLAMNVDFCNWQHKNSTNIMDFKYLKFCQDSESVLWESNKSSAYAIYPNFPIKIGQHYGFKKSLKSTDFCVNF